MGGERCPPGQIGVKNNKKIGGLSYSINVKYFEIDSDIKEKLNEKNVALLTGVKHVSVN